MGQKQSQQDTRVQEFNSVVAYNPVQEPEQIPDRIDETIKMIVDSNLSLDVKISRLNDLLNYCRNARAKVDYSKAKANIRNGGLTFGISLAIGVGCLIAGIIFLFLAFLWVATILSIIPQIVGLILLLVGVIQYANVNREYNRLTAQMEVIREELKKLNPNIQPEQDDNTALKVGLLLAGGVGLVVVLAIIAAVIGYFVYKKYRSPKAQGQDKGSHKKSRRVHIY